MSELIKKENENEKIEIVKSMSLDWLSFSWDPYRFTVPGVIDVMEAFFLTFPELHCDFIVEARVKSHYEKAFMLDAGMMIFYDTEDCNSPKGVNVSVPAHGLQTFFNKFGNPAPSVKDLFKELMNRGARMSRIDVCFDDFSKTYRPKDYIDWDINDCIKTRFRFSTFIKGTNGGYTYELGKRGSERFMRIYDKDKESIGISGEPLIDAVRYEFEIHNASARGFAQDIVDGKCCTMADLILSFFTVVDRKNNNITDRGQCPINEQWELWVKSQVSRIDGIKPSRDLPKKSFEKSYNHFCKQYTKSIGLFVKVLGREWVDDIITDGIKIANRDPVTLRIIQDIKSYNYDIG